MTISLSNKYRPTDFSEVIGQESIIKILSKQIELKSYKNCYLFSGPSGCGKTTLARIFSKKINYGVGNPIEIDAASNNGVDNIRNIIEGANQRSLDSEYKIYIIDECHMITTQGWNAFLKCIEEPPKYTMFMFCTTDPQKVPATIVNRCQVYNLTRISSDKIFSRLSDICEAEGYAFEVEALNQLAKMSGGSLRQAIAYLDKCKDFSTTILLDNVFKVLGDYSYDTMFELTNSIIDNNQTRIIEIIEKLYLSGSDLKLFIDSYIDFVLDLSKYCLFKNYNLIKIPKSMNKAVEWTTNIENNVKFFNRFVDKLLVIKQTIKGDSMAKNTIEIMLLNMERI